MSAVYCTPAEASEMWCPFSQVALGGNVTDIEFASNRPGIPNGNQCTCIGPKCMAWRWGSAYLNEKPKRGSCGLVE